MTRPYISSFNYIEKMSNEKYPQNDKNIWDILFRAFLLNHSKLGLSSYVYASTTKKLMDLSDEEKRVIKREANTIISIYIK